MLQSNLLRSNWLRTSIGLISNELNFRNSDNSKHRPQLFQFNSYKYMATSNKIPKIPHIQSGDEKGTKDAVGGSTDPELQKKANKKTNQSTFIVQLALLGNLTIAVAKTLAWVHSGSSAMLSEAIHSYVDTGNQVSLIEIV